MTKLEVLKWGLNHIAQNHEFSADTNWEEEDGVMCIYGGRNAPTLADVRFLCEDLEIPFDAVTSTWAGIDVDTYWDGWLQEHGNEEYTNAVQWWRKNGVQLGS